MIQDIKQHHLHYALLAIWLGAVMMGIILSRGNQALEGMVLVVGGLGYVVWGLGHHYKIGDLSSKIMIEYGLMMILIVSIITAVLVSR